LKGKKRIKRAEGPAIPKGLETDVKCKKPGNGWQREHQLLTRERKRKKK